MVPTTLLQTASQGESDTIEFKKSTADLNGIGETLCAFLNGKGGRVFIGISASGEVVGQHVSDKTQQEMAAMLAKLEPSGGVEIELVPLSLEKQVVTLVAYASKTNRPFTFAGRAYERVGTTTRLMPQFSYQTLLLERVHGERRWETEIATNYRIEDLDHEEILRTVRLGIQAGRLPESTSQESFSEVLSRLDLYGDGALRKAAVVLFGKRKSWADYPQCQIRLARFLGTSKSEFLHNIQLEGHAFFLLEEGMEFLRTQLPIAGKFLPGVIARQDTPLFPLAALREALVNALCHRSYVEVGGAVSVAIYDHSVEIWSMGELPFGQKLEELKKPHASKPRNPVIANTFFRRGLIEKWGRGIQTIIELCVQAGHPEPEFVEQAGSFVVRFLPSSYVPPHQVSYPLSERQKQLLSILANYGELSLAEIQAVFPHPPASRTLRADLQQLKRIGLVTYQGKGKRVKWLFVRK